jgi:hypothetical protein
LDFEVGYVAVHKRPGFTAELDASLFGPAAARMPFFFRRLSGLAVSGLAAHETIENPDYSG